MLEVRCSACGKLLGRIEGKAEIQCPRCKKLNKVVRGIENAGSTSDSTGDKPNRA